MDAPARLPIVAVIPVRDLEGAKTRLGEVLDAEERQVLVESMLRRTLEAARSATSIDDAILISRDAAARAIAEHEGVTALAQTTRGLNAGIVEAQVAYSHLHRGPFALLVLPADLTRVTAEALDAVAAVAAPSPSVTLVTDRQGRGTNILLLSPAGIIDPAFGANSRATHAQLAHASGAEYREVTGTLLALDLDTPDDLLAAEAQLPELADAR